MKETDARTIKERDTADKQDKAVVILNGFNYRLHAFNSNTMFSPRTPTKNTPFGYVNSHTVKYYLNFSSPCKIMAPNREPAVDPRAKSFAPVQV